MIRALYTIEMEGRKVEMLFTPSLYGIARRKNVVIQAETEDFAQIIDAYTKIMYLAAINAWEVRLFDDPSLGEAPYKLMDFVQWAAAEPKEFGKMMRCAVEALTGKPFGADNGKEVKKK